MNLEQSIVFSGTIFAQLVDDELVLLDMESEKYFGLNEVGTSIWQAMQENKKLQDVYEVLLEEYDVTPEVLKEELMSFVASMSDAGLITLED